MYSDVLHADCCIDRYGLLPFIYISIMKKIFFLPLFFFFFFYSCNRKSVALLQPSNLNSSFINIDAGKPYTLRTRQGAMVKIAAGSFDVPAGTKVTIELKEAYGMQDMLRAGLTTTSNGKLLQSGGMIFFSATAEGKPVGFLKDVGIDIPATAYNTDMKLFSGEVKEDGTINWVDPVPLTDSTPAVKNLETGRALFKANCASCHRPNAELAGPKLAGARMRAPDPDWVYRFVNNVNAMVATDAYAMKLKAKYGSVMTQFNLSKGEVKAIMDYCDSELAINDSFPAPAVLQDTSTADCGYDTIPVYRSDSIEVVVADSFATYDPLEGLPDMVKAGSPFYSFTIDRNGWYNIDCFIDNNRTLVSDVILTAAPKDGDYKVIQAYLCMPSKRLLTDGYLYSGSFTFSSSGEHISLIKNERAFVLMLAWQGEKFFYGVQHFRIASEQHLVVPLKESSPDQVAAFLRKNELDGEIIDLNKPVVEELIESNQPDSSVTEWQVIKRDCNNIPKAK